MHSYGSIHSLLVLAFAGASQKFSFLKCCTVMSKLFQAGLIKVAVTWPVWTFWLQALQ